MVNSFEELQPALHPLVLRSLASLQFSQPTAVQSELVSLALSSSRDILARARTGSGKTLSYGIPIVHTILTKRDRSQRTDEAGSTRALILVPTRELAEQVKNQLSQLVNGLGLAQAERQPIKVVNAVGGDRKKRKRGPAQSELEDGPDVVIATPSKALEHLRERSLKLDRIDHLVIDEADLILSYGHSSEDIRAILNGPWGLPQVYQSFLMSATVTGEVEELKGIILRDPAIVKIEDKESELANLTQFFTKCSEEDKFLLLYVLLKLKLIKGKCLIFVNSTDRGYRVKLYLEQFGIKCGVLNSELPFNSRYHAVQEFNRGVFDYLIATDESGIEGQDRDTNENLISTQPETSQQTDAAASTSSKKRKRDETSSTITEYGVSRGIDFVDVACVLNFDLPSSSRSYTHRVGRTARAGRSGTALSFVVPKSLIGKKKATVPDIGVETARKDEGVWKRIKSDQQAKGCEIKEYSFDSKQVEAFRYRMEDALRAVTKASVREARIKEIKSEVLNSEKLKAHFEDNPKDLAFLRHDKPLHPSRVQPHLKHVPQYLMPRIASVGHSGGESQQVARPLNVPFNKPSSKRAAKYKGKHKRQDPLKGKGSFSLRSRPKK